MTFLQVWYLIGLFFNTVYCLMVLMRYDRLRRPTTPAVLFMCIYWPIIDAAVLIGKFRLSNPKDWDALGRMIQTKEEVVG